MNNTLTRLESFLEPAKEDIDNILYDSRANQKLIRQSLALLENEKVTRLDSVFLFPPHRFYYVGTATREELSLYFQHQVWRFDFLSNLSAHHSFEVFDYNLMPGLSENYIELFRDTVFVMVDYHYNQRKDMFMFGIDREHFYKMDVNEKLRIFNKFKSIIAYLYKSLQLANCCALPREQEAPVFRLERQRSRFSNYREVLNRYDLTEKGLTIMRYLALGCSGKQIAQYLNNSQRTVESHIHMLSKKFQAGKPRLEDIARIIINDLIPKTVYSHLFSHSPEQGNCKFQPLKDNVSPG